MVVSEDRRRAIVGWYRVLNHANPRPARLPMRGLAPELDYRISAWPAVDDAISRANELTRRGDDLQAAGLIFDIERHSAMELGDFWSRLFVLEAI